VAQLCVNTLPATRITLITNGIQFGSLRVKEGVRGISAVKALRYKPGSIPDGVRIFH
jgi:hypothetical protein